MAPLILELDRIGLIPLSSTTISSWPSHFHSVRRSTVSSSVILTTPPNFHKFRLRLGIYRIPRGILVKHRGQLSTVVAKAEQQEHIDDIEVSNEEVNQDTQLSVEEVLESNCRQKSGQLKKRIIFGLGIGISAGGVVLAGGWVFTVALAAAVFVGAREYFELVRSRGIASGMTPPPRYVSRACSVICSLMPMLTLYFGNIDISVTSAAFVVAMALLLQRGNPRFAQLSSTIFGLFYCGYLPCFWVKLRCGLAAPALNTNDILKLFQPRSYWKIAGEVCIISLYEALFLPR